MPRPDLLKLALLAMEDGTALAALGQAVIALKWCDRRVPALVRTGRANGFRKMKTTARDLHYEMAAKPTREWARAIVAVLLFQNWPVSMFQCPVFLRSRVGFDYYDDLMKSEDAPPSGVRLPPY